MNIETYTKKHMDLDSQEINSLKCVKSILVGLRSNHADNYVDDDGIWCSNKIYEECIELMCFLIEHPTMEWEY